MSPEKTFDQFSIAADVVDPFTVGKVHELYGKACEHFHTPPKPTHIPHMTLVPPFCMTQANAQELSAMLRAMNIAVSTRNDHPLKIAMFEICQPEIRQWGNEITLLFPVTPVRDGRRVLDSIDYLRKTVIRGFGGRWREEIPQGIFLHISVCSVSVENRDEMVDAMLHDLGGGLGMCDPFSIENLTLCQKHPTLGWRQFAEEERVVLPTSNTDPDANFMMRL